MTTLAEANHPSRISAPGSRLRAVTPGTENLPDGVCKALFVTEAGEVEVVAELDATPISLGELPAGTLIPVRVLRVAS